MQPESRRLLTDMRDAARDVRTFVADKSLADLQSDDLLRSALYFKFVIIGEALAQLARQDEETANRISEMPRIIGFRNQVIHGYAIIDDEITWRIVETKVPILLQELNTLLT